MSALWLDVGPNAYELRLDGNLLGRLDGGAAALLAGAGERLREIDLEAAIERSEEWLMPSSRSFQELELRVRDARKQHRTFQRLRGARSPTTLLRYSASDEKSRIPAINPIWWSMNSMMTLSAVGLS
jgi:hypothetical protein